jgi:hypothetical protein
LDRESFEHFPVNFGAFGDHRMVEKSFVYVLVDAEHDLVLEADSEKVQVCCV